MQYIWRDDTQNDLVGNPKQERPHCGDFKSKWIVILYCVLKKLINMKSFAPTELDLINICVLDVT